MVVAFDLDATASRVGLAVAKHHREAIAAGREPSGGSQRSLSPEERKRAAQGKRSSARGGGQEGRFIKSIGSTASGGDLKASSDVAADPFFDDFQAREASRGVEYLETDGDVDELVEQLLDDELKRQGFA